MLDQFLTKESIKILDVHMSYNKKLQDDINFYTAVKNIFNMIKLSLEGKITTFNSLAICKLAYLALRATVPKSIIKELNEIQKKFLWSHKRCKIKHGTLCNDLKNRDLKNVDIELKLLLLICS